jgi:hypothetical protein
VNQTLGEDRSKAVVTAPPRCKVCRHKNARARGRGQASRGNPALPVVLKGDAAAHYEIVSAVLEICKRLDITEVGLVTKKAAG